MFDSEQMQSFMQTFAPNKLRLTTLREVFSAFWSEFDHYLLHQQPYYRKKVFFWYDNAEWTGTFHKERSSYHRREVTFTIIKLPNDSYVYSPQYAAIDGGVTPEDADSIDFLTDVIARLSESNAPEIEGILECTEEQFEKRVQFYYRSDIQRFDLYIWSEDENSCVTIKFENGFAVKMQPHSNPVVREKRFRSFLSGLTRANLK